MINRFEIFNEQFFACNYNYILNCNNYKFYEILDCFYGINDKEKTNLKINDIELNSKNTFFADLSTINSIISEIRSERLQKEYIKLKLENFKDKDLYDEKIEELVLELKNNVFFDSKIEINVDLNKILKSTTTIEINSIREYIKVLLDILNFHGKKTYILFISDNIIKQFDLNTYVKELIKKENIIIFHICDKNTKISDNSNIFIILDYIIQISKKELFERIINNITFNIEKQKEYLIKLNELFLYSFDKSGVDIMKSNMNYIQLFSNVIENEFNLNENNSF